MKQKIKFRITKRSLGKDFFGLVWSIAFIALLVLYPDSVVVQHYAPWAVLFFHLSAFVLLFFCGRIFYREYTKENIISVGAIILFLFYLGVYIVFMFGMDLILSH